MTDDATAYCINCNDRTKYITKVCDREITVKGISFKYVHHSAYCSECGQEVYVPDINDQNAEERTDGFYRFCSK